MSGRLPDYDAVDAASGDFGALLDLVRSFGAVEIRTSDLSPLVHVDLRFHVLPERRLTAVHTVASCHTRALALAIGEALSVQAAEDLRP